MKFDHYFNRTALQIAVAKKENEIVKLLLSHPKIDINIISVFKTLFP